MFHANDWMSWPELLMGGVKWRHHGQKARPWWSEVATEPPRRAERGEVRYLVLDAISERSRHGYEVIQTIQERSLGQYRPSPGVIYPTLQMLEELGHARAVETDGRKAYAITDEGKRELQQNRDAVVDFYERFGDRSWDASEGGFADTMRHAVRLIQALKRGAAYRRMTPRTISRIKAALDEALAKIDDAFSNRD